MAMRTTSHTASGAAVAEPAAEPTIQEIETALRARLAPLPARLEHAQSEAATANRKLEQLTLGGATVPALATGNDALYARHRQVAADSNNDAETIRAEIAALTTSLDAIAKLRTGNDRAAAIWPEACRRLEAFRTAMREARRTYVAVLEHSDELESLANNSFLQDSRIGGVRSLQPLPVPATVFTSVVNPWRNTFTADANKSMVDLFEQDVDALLAKRASR